MVSMRFVLLAAFALAAPAASGAQQSAPAPAADAGAPHPHALAIAGLLLPLDEAVEAGIRVGKRAYFEMFKSNAEVAELESAYPGIAAALWPVLEPELRRATVEDHPEYLNSVASFYTSRFSPAELEALHTLYATPTGQKVIRALYRDSGPDAIVAEIIRAPDAPVSQAAVDETFRASTGRLLETLTKEDEGPILAVLRVIPEAKLARANEDLSRLVVDWLNRPTPELDARLQATMGKAMERYIAEHPPKD